MAAPALHDRRDYRRGVILGLTFAETLLLLLFLLLLAAAALRERDQRELDKIRPAAEVLSRLGLPASDPDALARRIAEGERAAAELPNVREELARVQRQLAEAEAVRRSEEELAARLERSEAGRRQLSDSLAEARRERERALRRLREVEASLALMQAKLPQMGDPANWAGEFERLSRRAARAEARLAELERERDRAEALVRIVEQRAAATFARQLDKGRELEARVAELEAERDRLRARSAESGRAFDRELARKMIAGGVYPSCWEEEGRPVFVFAIALRLNGRIVVKDLAPAPFRAGEPWASIGRFERNVPIDVSTFVVATRALTDWSRRQDPPCRFWIKVRRELPVSAPTSEYLRVVGPLGSAANDHLPFYRVGG